MIPKIIHYCWFGGNPLTNEARKCIDSWKKYCPDYRIIEWNESNYDVNKNRYMSDAYKEKKWAFVSDYARVDVVYQNGGIYMDTDVELIKPLDCLLNCGLYGGWESRDPLMKKMGMPFENSVNFGLGFGAEKHHPALKDILDFYEHIDFYNADGSLNLVACPRYQTQILKLYGLDDEERCEQRLRNNIVIYPEDYFSPKSQITGEVSITSNTISIHHFSMTWQNPREVAYVKLEWRLSNIIGYKFAHWVVGVISIPYRGVRKIKSLFH